MRIPDMIQRHSTKTKKPFVSLEFFPPKKEEDWPAFMENAEKLQALRPLYCSVTYGAGGSTQDNTIEICSRLSKDYGFTVMPHLTSVMADKAKIDTFLAATRDLGIENVLALRGDRPAGFTGTDAELFTAFPHASDLVQYIRARQPQMGIGVAGFVDAHPESRVLTSDLEVMRHKVECGANFVITQLFFDNRLYFDYVERLQRRNINIPVIPGILPIRNLAALRFTLRLCNALVPGLLLNSILQAHEEGGNPAVYALGLRHAREQIRGLLEGGAPGVHLYTLNRADMCLEIMDGLIAE